MPEEGLETTEIKEQIEEALERAEKAGEEAASPRWATYLSLSTAILAVLAAVASLQSGSLANDALIEKNEAVLFQAQASDQWSYYQAKGIKANLSSAQADLLSGKNNALAQKYRSEAERYKNEQDEINRSAKEMENKVKEKNEAAERFLDHHHRFAYSVTLFQVAIALSAIAALTRKRGLWLGGLGIAFFGILSFVWGFF